MAKGRAGYSASRSSSFRTTPSYSYRSSPSYSQPAPQPSFFSSIINGFSFGTGYSLANNTIHQIFSSTPYSSSTKSCDTLHKSMNECLQQHFQDKDICKEAIRDYENCLQK